MSSALASRHTSSNSVTRNYCCRAGEVTLAQAPDMHRLRIYDKVVRCGRPVQDHRKYYQSKAPMRLPISLLL